MIDREPAELDLDAMEELDPELVAAVTEKVREILSRDNGGQVPRGEPIPAVSLDIESEFAAAAASARVISSTGALSGIEFHRDQRLDDAGLALVNLLAGRQPDLRHRLSVEQSARLVSQLIDCWQVLPSLSREGIYSGLPPLLHGVDSERLQQAWLAMTAYSVVQVAAAAELLAGFRGTTVPYVLLKGSAAACTVYPLLHQRTGWDVDLGVASADLAQAEEAVIAAGYHRSQQDPASKQFYESDPNLRASVEAQHYELGFLAKRLVVSGLPQDAQRAVEAWAQSAAGHWFIDADGQPSCFATVDVHHAVSLDIPLDEALASAYPLTVDGRPTSVPGPSWLAFHLIFKIYWEGVNAYGKGLYQYADLVRIVEVLQPSDFDALVKMLRHHRLEAGGHYVLRRLPEFGVGLPTHVRDFLDETAHPRGNSPTEENDLGDMWPKLWRSR